MPQPAFHYLSPEGVVVEGVSTQGMMVWAATGRRIGRLRGFILDAAHQRIRYLVVRASVLSRKMTLLPLSMARIDIGRRAIEVDLDDGELERFSRLPLDALRP
jgi:sporulation protein YlmC with PRC-barrel domain